MSFEIKNDKSMDHELRRLITNDVDEALALLSDPPSPEMSREKAVHEARKIFKRQRALFRLVRGSIGGRDFSRANHAFRDAGRALSNARDAKVLVDAFFNLLEHFKPQLAPDAFAPVREKLLKYRHKLIEAQSASLHEVGPLLRDQKRRAEERELKQADWNALAPGARRTYRDGRDAMKDAIDHPTFESLHEWRKRVKDLWHQTQLLEPSWPQELKRFGDDLHHLSDLLGDDHDLAVLRQTIMKDPKDFGQPDEIDPLVHLIDTRRCELEAEAIALGERLYAEKPGAFVERLHGYWQAWQDGDTAARIT